MATHASAEKRHRQNLKRREKNRQERSALRTAMKSTLAALTAGDVKSAQTQVRATTRMYDKAVVHGLLHRKNAARHISQINSKLASISKK